MAQLKNLNKVWTAPKGDIVTVGHNRTIEPDDRFHCRLHGNTVAIIAAKNASGIARVDLDVCGYLSNTTRNAINDFLDAFGINARVSIAGGFLSVRWKMPSGAWREKRCNGYGKLSFTGHRYIKEESF